MQEFSLAGLRFMGILIVFWPIAILGRLLEYLTQLFGGKGLLPGD